MTHIAAHTPTLTYEVFLRRSHVHVHAMHVNVHVLQYSLSSMNFMVTTWLCTLHHQHQLWRYVPVAAAGHT